MLKLLKYLKNSGLYILAILILLVGQVFCDLSLPTYTSQIVNVGIQQGGIASAAPEQIRESSLEDLFLLMTEEEQAAVLSAYTLQDGIYYQNSDADVDSLTTAFGRAMLGVELLSGDPTQYGLPEGVSLDTLRLLDDASRAQAISSLSEAISQYPEAIVEQMAIQYVREEYEAIGVDMNALQMNYILTTGLYMLLLALASMAATIAVTLIASRLAASLGREIRGRVFSKVVSFSSHEMDQFSTASLITRNTNDIQQVQLMMVLMLRILFYAPVLAIGGTIQVLNTNVSMVWILIVGILAILTIVIVLFNVTMPKFKGLQKLVDKLNLVTREILTGLPVIRAFSRQKSEEERFDQANTALYKTNLFVNRVMALMMPLMMLLMNGITVLIMWNGAVSIDAGQMQVGDMMAFIQYTMMIIMAFLMISMVSIMLPRATVSATRIQEVLETEPSVHDAEKPCSFDPEKHGVVEFDHVSFQYPDAEEYVLHDISFTAKPGQTTAIIGSTGSGKSTLVNLIPRFFDVTEGAIRVDGADIRTVPQKELRAKIGYVPQKAILFSGTINSNIAYGDDSMPAQQIERAAAIAQSTDFITAKEDGFDSHISQGGTNVSGGQKQRLSIARALAIQPEILIFDDSFSALDYKTDRALREALAREQKDAAVIIVAQRISTVRNAEQILVLDDGCLAGIGTHSQLMESCEVYRQIALSQLTEEELA